MRRQPAQLLTSLRRPCPPRRSHERSVAVAPSTRRHVQIQATPPSSFAGIEAQDTPITDLTPTSTTDQPDARFEILGTTSSTLSVTIAASQNLYTRRGSVIGVAGSTENAVSTLSPLSPLQRLPLGVPFLYQRVASTTPLNLLVSARSPASSFSVIHLDGRVDWKVVQRNGLVAWTGQALTVKPSVNVRMSLAHWGNTNLAGRGLVALAGAGQVYQVTLKADETYVAHPSNILAYTINQHLPQPYRFKSSTLRLQLPNVAALFPPSKFIRDIKNSDTYKAVSKVLFTIRTWTRRTIWGDRLFLRFHGPTTILVQSRGSRIRDALSDRDVNEIADAPAGAIQPAPRLAAAGSSAGAGSLDDQQQRQQTTRMTYATVDRGGKVRFDSPESRQT